MRIDSYKVIFWDFDGVIKDSVDVKTGAFIKLFEEYGRDIAERVRNHHLANGGMSRFEKIPLYAQWAGRELSREQVQEYSERFSQIALQGVLDSAWVPGAEPYLRDNRHSQIFVLTSATPNGELDLMLQTLRLRDCFKMAFGHPLSKREAIAKSMKVLAVTPSDCLMIGDARADMEAARANDISFLLRRHPSNDSVFFDYTGPAVQDFLES